MKKDYLVKIAVIGTGSVGLVSGACLADFGNTVVCVDTDEKKIQKLRDGGIPLFELALDKVVKRTVSIGTARKVKGRVSEELARRGVEYQFDVVSNPEFLREGTAVYDFQGGARCRTGRCRRLDAPALLVNAVRLRRASGTPGSPGDYPAIARLL